MANSSALPAPPDLLSPDVARRLRSLELGSVRRRPGQLRGDRRSTKRGTSIEFADYRNYAPGDDLRRVDWNLYARTDRMFTKLYEEEEDMSVRILVDASDSMAFGAPSKLDVARRLAAALGYVALAELDRLRPAVIGPSGVTEHRPLRGQAAVGELLEFLASIRPAGSAALGESLSRYAWSGRGRGLVVLISDLYDPGDVVRPLRQLCGRGGEAVVLHVLSPEELEPDLAGDVELVDSETADRSPLTADGPVLEAYRSRLDEWLSGLASSLRRSAMGYVLVRSDEPLEEVLFRDLRRARVLV